jgi:acetyltransferase-like isoleucine patch superfamily enzyme
VSAPPAELPPVPAPTDLPAFLAAEAPRGALATLRAARRHGTPLRTAAALVLRRARLQARWRGRLELGPAAYVGSGVLIDIAPGARLELGAGTWLGGGSRIRVHGGTVRVGEGSLLGRELAIAAHREIEIGARCIVSDGVSIIDARQPYPDVERPIREQPLEIVPVRVRDGAKIGPHASLLAGAEIGERAVLGPRAVVDRRVAAGAVATGVPAPPKPAARGRGRAR